MKQHYFVVVLAHSLHGRLRRIHIPHQALYVLLGLLHFSVPSRCSGMVSSYLRMSLESVQLQHPAHGSGYASS